MVTELSQDNLQEVVAENKTVFVQFSASWCGNCRIMKPKFKKLSNEITDATFVIVDAEKFPESRKLAQVNNLPTFAAFKSGEFVNQVQTNKFESLKELVDEVAAN
ncbi:thioredoxin family protein [Roseivirga pacifica]|uniref:thioredoxin family protein n=1 Tax=Roseivirga pacifica TaxID=1267423 RepID=UPI003BB100C8